MDKAVKKITPKDEELSRVQDNLIQAIQQLLDFANGAASQQAIFTPVLQSVRGPGTPLTVKTLALLVKGRQDGNFQVGQPTVQFGELQVVSANAVTIPQKDATFFCIGQSAFWGSKGLPDGFVIFPQVSGLAFRVSSIDGLSNLLQTTTDGKTTGVNFVGTSFTGNFISPAGFKNTISCGTMWNNNYSANASAQLMLSCYNTSTALGAITSGTAPRSVKMPFAGSIVGASLSQSGTVTGATTLNFYKNGTMVAGWAAGSGAGTFWTTYAKGVAALSFAAGDTFTFFIQNTTAGNCQVQADITVEMGA